MATASGGWEGRGRPCSGSRSGVVPFGSAVKSVRGSGPESPDRRRQDAASRRVRTRGARRVRPAVDKSCQLHTCLPSRMPASVKSSIKLRIQCKGCQRARGQLPTAPVVGCFACRAQAQQKAMEHGAGPTRTQGRVKALYTAHCARVLRGTQRRRGAGRALRGRAGPREQFLSGSPPQSIIWSPPQRINYQIILWMYQEIPGSLTP